MQKECLSFGVAVVFPDVFALGRKLNYIRFDLWLRFTHLAPGYIVLLRRSRFNTPFAIRIASPSE